MVTLVIFITIGFLSCWFLLYALIQWTQDLRRRSTHVGVTSTREDRRQDQILNFRKKEA